ncbi:MAG: acetyl/propionyl/methylcrotonyl-CoA carboxylase subunit alpha [Sphingomonadales bacterium]|nr:MAG: acetyl/propionyl/methylcrotonyl-CoA carboxylase subunit alpha [Sphingomonadales bacterium]
MHKILIANRGEIACRIIRTAERMGLETVAVYSEADADAPHVRMATQAVLIGPPPAAQSYLLVDRLIDAARKTGADAVHPGYGFLSENADFAQACADFGLIFIGPPPSAIRAMGLKDAAKRLMRQANVPIVPGYQGDDQSLDRLTRAASAIGYPMLIKAVAGGGGKGMRLVEDASGFSDALLAAKREAERAFGNDGILIEKYLTRPRHVEVQVFADSHGNTIHLFERDCSLQRRHQKVVEEAPAPGLPDAMRTAMGEAAVTAARAIGYVGAGTVEFIVDVADGMGADGAPFYFMEMNTRLQVEPPVTEMITGQDLVEWQIRVARGEPLPLLQHQVPQRGAAVEVRLYAEDPDNGFLPSTGKLSRLVMPAVRTGVRVDSGIEEGGTVGIHYDPMLAKLIAHGPDRATAIDRLIGALDETEIEGVRSNRAFLARLIGHPAFRAGDVDTGFIERYRADLAPATDLPPRLAALAALALATPKVRLTASSPWEALGDWRLNLPSRRRIDLYAADGVRFALVLTSDGAGVIIDGLEKPLCARGRWAGDRQFSADLDGDLIHATVLCAPGHVEVRSGGQMFQFLLSPPGTDSESVHGGDGIVRAPMPGRVLSLGVQPGQSVSRGARLLVLEAMKMEHRLDAPVDGTVTAVHTAEGAQVSGGALLVEIEAAPQDA